MNAREQPTPQRVLLLAAHPNDEVGIAATLGTHARRGDEVFAAWFARDDRPEVEAQRRDEAVRVMRMIGAPAEHLFFPPLVPIHLTTQLPELVEAVRDVVARVRPDIAYVPAFEGGHPDHDAMNFAAWEATLTTGIECREYPLYHGAKKKRPLLPRTPAFGQLLPAAGDPTVRPLDQRERRTKRTAVKLSRSQQPLFTWLLRLSGDEQRFFASEEMRPLPMRDYQRPPHERPLLYEQNPEYPLSFDEFASAVRRYYWTGGVGEDDAL